jgi:NADH-quinone oxidoreductase subunit C
LEFIQKVSKDQISNPLNQILQAMNESAPNPEKPIVPPKAVATIPKVVWGSIGNKTKQNFNIFPQPETAGGIEAILLKDNSQLIDFMKLLKKEFNYQVLFLINAVEYKEATQLIYQLQKLEPEYGMLCIKVNLGKENQSIETLSSVWESANWYERELWDMHGIKFNGHPNLVRILNPDSWEGFPLRKDYIPPIDALNGPITAVKENIKPLSKSERADIEIIEEIAITV